MSPEKLTQAARDLYGQELENEIGDENITDEMDIDDAPPPRQRMPYPPLNEMEQQRQHQNPNETPAKLKLLLAQMDQALEVIQEKESYELGVFSNPDYLESEKFRTMFLRSDNYNPQAAAKRMVLYWDRKVNLFGVDKAFRPLRIPTDFQPQDETAAANGGFRLLPDRDEAGRAIIFSYRRYYDNRHDRIDSMLRLFWCIAHAALDDPEEGDDVQKDGIVGITANGMDDIAADSMLQACSNHLQFYTVFYNDLLHVLPVKVAGIHMFAPNPWVKLLIEHVLKLQGPHIRARLQIYDGTTEENLENLEDYGITPDMVPAELGGALDFNYHDWFMRKGAEDAARYGTGMTSSSNNTTAKHANHGDNDKMWES
eukprot:CAMPEP_0195286304 /NCGR_PEP_ID=MMETSP0707-20130614/3810_1 /TAXON_ID=33640 /ORGANISM="Asterionellopsis glacialis, Strain CCMP134" /LENGTH=369 /DNA_ID=CAMNT_0040345925 /DNA_START=350 /DNA_END=1459 /DNA_ORIENTATION=+